MFLVITKPWITSHSSTIIDHILTNTISTKMISSGIVKTDKIIFLFFSYIDEKIILDRKGEETILKRKINDVFWKSFRYCL